MYLGGSRVLNVYMPTCWITHTYFVEVMVNVAYITSTTGYVYVWLGTNMCPVVLCECEITLFAIS